MIPFADSFESQDYSQQACVTVAFLIHTLLLLWNPVIFRQTWETLTAPGDGPVIVWDSSGPQTDRVPGSPLPGPVKSSLPRFTSGGSIPAAPVHAAVPKAPVPSLTSKTFRFMPFPSLP